MIQHAQIEAPFECCGLLAGLPEKQQVVERYPLINKLQSPTRYESDPQSMFAALRDMRQRGIEILAIYHSHPTSAPIPSRTDMAEYDYPGILSFIISLQKKEPEVRAWWLTNNEFHEGEWDAIDDSNK